MEYPHIYRNGDGVELIARDEIQAAAIEREGFQPIGKYVEKQRKSKE